MSEARHTHAADATTGRVHGRRLRPGRYVLQAPAAYPGGGASTAKAGFRVKP